MGLRDIRQDFLRFCSKKRGKKRVLLYKYNVKVLMAERSVKRCSEQSMNSRKGGFCRRMRRSPCSRAAAFGRKLPVIFGRITSVTEIELSTVMHFGA